MPFAWFVAFRYLRSAKGQTTLILAAVAVGVAVVVFLSALIGVAGGANPGLRTARDSQSPA